MLKDIVLKADHVSKKFCRGLKHVMLYGAKDIASNMIGLSSHSEKLRDGEFWAVDDVSFELKQGETLGLIGPNGSGKSTMLKMINGIYMPDKGNIEIKGRVGALIEVGAGFHPMLTGRENIYVNGAILGMGKKEIDRKFDKIVDFADIGDFIDSPVKHYSSGMNVRLGFAIAVHCEPEILLVDEVLAVGDMSFQRKCIEKIKEMQSRETSIIFISHNMYLVQGICTNAILLNKGKTLGSGDVFEIIKEYEFQNNISSLQLKGMPGTPVQSRGTGEIDIANVHFKNSDGEEIKTFSVGDSVFVNVSYFAHKRIDNPVFSIGIIRKDGLKCGLSRTKFSNVEIPFIEGKGEIRIEIEKIQLNSGDYFLEFAIADEFIVNPYILKTLDMITIMNPPMPNIGDSCGIYFPAVKWNVEKIVEKI